VTGEHAGEPLSQDEELSQEPGREKHKHNRVTTPAPEGSDPAPAPEPARSSGDENDERLKGDVPPHWG
jgi:hypothetical protein